MVSLTTAKDGLAQVLPVVPTASKNKNEWLLLFNFSVFDGTRRNDDAQCVDDACYVNDAHCVYDACHVLRCS